MHQFVSKIKSTNRRSFVICGLFIFEFAYSNWQNWSKMPIFQSKMDFLSANLVSTCQNEETYLPRKTRETFTSISDWNRTDFWCKWQRENIHFLLINLKFVCEATQMLLTSFEKSLFSPKSFGNRIPFLLQVQKVQSLLLRYEICVLEKKLCWLKIILF